MEYPLVTKAFEMLFYTKDGAEWVRLTAFGEDGARLVLCDTERDNTLICIDMTNKGAAHANQD